MPLIPFTGTLGTRGAAHLLRRTTFGPTLQQINDFSSLTPARAVQQLYRPVTPLPDAPPPVDPDQPTNAWVITGTTDPQKMAFQYEQFFKGWVIGQMLSTGVDSTQSLAYSAREKLVFFMHTHLTAITEKVGSSRALYFQNELFRRYVLDANTSTIIPEEKLNLKELTKKICVDNAMLRLLDGNINIRGGNENFGRELLELYTIGRGLEGPNTLPSDLEMYDYFFYKEHDVQAAAKVFSGFNFDDTFSTIDEDTELPRGVIRGSITNASAHSNEPKQFSERFGDAIIQPDPLLLNGTTATEASALDEISQLIDLIYDQPETARHICRKIYRFFMYHEINEALQNDIIESMATVFRNNDFKIQPVIEALITSQHFYNNNSATDYTDDAFGGIIKSPLDLVIGTHRFFGTPVPDMATDAPGFYDFTGSIVNLMKDKMGLDFYQPFDVAGYDAYHQYPIYHRSWITVNNLTNRYDFIDNFMAMFDALAFVRANIPFATASNARLLVIYLAEHLLPVTDNLTFDTTVDESQNATITSERLQYFLEQFLGIIDPDPEASWTVRYTGNHDPETMTNQLRNLFNAMLQSPEYQLH